LQRAQSFENFGRKKMKRFMYGIFGALMVVALASITALADKGKTEKKIVTFPQDITVNGTVIKAGDYEVKFDEATNTLSILKDGKVKATTPAHMEARSEKAKDTALRTREANGGTELVGVTFHGWTKDVVVGSGGAAGGSQQ